jgi:hypothetical protein
VCVPRSLNPIERIFGLIKRDVRGGSRWSSSDKPVTSILAAVARIRVGHCRSFVDDLWPEGG